MATPATAAELAAEVARLLTTPRLTLSVSEACDALGVSWDFWQEHVAAEVRIVRRGRRKLVPVAELERWLEANAHAIDTGKSTPTARKSPANRQVRASRAPARTGRRRPA